VFVLLEEEGPGRGAVGVGVNRDGRREPERWSQWQSRSPPSPPPPPSTFGKARSAPVDRRPEAQRLGRADTGGQHEHGD